MTRQGAPSSDEKLRLARHLHDGIAQDLVALGYQLDLTLAHQPEDRALRHDIRRARFEVDSLIRKVRETIFELRTVTQSNFTQALQVKLADLAEGQKINLQFEDIHADTKTLEAISDISQELLRNALKHARASQIEIALYNLNNRICLEVSDDGVGGAEVKPGRFGLTGIIERVRELGGNISVASKSALNKGTSVTILL